MSGHREWFYNTVKNDTEIAARIGNRFYQGESLDGAPRVKPFGVYRFGNTSPDNRYRGAERQYATIYWHDLANPGAYEINIDPLVERSRVLLDNIQGSPVDNVLTCRYLEASSDQDDREMGTILRYVRFQLILPQRG